ncbi:hypothetical protein TUSST3_50710 [Streptomyces sp. TUS-ST3]|jgi:hypothetical protein|uniref:hypothetical protein n=1 Tax=Streptomyces sp. TUS-ST3 TaxID=3025591 RepID=UPI00235B5234|nr:hypothetical protein [Streptomyces sp. TUS-ST3]GLP68448.1 hypothetical protein TUSST3_50710 [Streptomyces sp. TUS-ST3]
MGVRSGPGGQVLTLDTLVRLGRELRAPGTSGTPYRLVVPEGMTVPLGCDAVGVPVPLSRQLVSRLPRVGCVYADDTHWWWLVPADSDYALEWPAPAQYATGAVVPDAPVVPSLVRRPEGTLPYTPPIPLYLALCRLTGTTPNWSRPVSSAG